MARPRKYSPLNVFLNSRLVGRLTREPSGAIAFAYDPCWLAWEHTLPISLSLPLREDRYVGEPVIAVFDNLLPDTDAVRRRLAERVGARGVDAFSLLAKVGRDCVGALQFLAEEDAPEPAGVVRGSALSDDQIAALIDNLVAAPLGLDDDEDFRISVAGAQEKTALLRMDGGWRKPHGTTATTHILKPQIGRLPNGIDLSNSVENEFFCLKLLEAFGLPAAQAEMAVFGGRRVLVVERFDRRWTKDNRLIRLPQEDCCQALSVPSSLKYQKDGGPGVIDILSLLKGGDAPEADQITLLKAVVLFWLIGATDGHAKNFSVFLSPGGRFRMTPIYDVLSAQPSVDAGQIRRNRMTLAMSVGDNNRYRIDTITPRHFMQTAAVADLARGLIDRVLDELRDMAEQAFNAVASKLPSDFPEELVASIETAARTRLRQL